MSDTDCGFLCPACVARDSDQSWLLNVWVQPGAKDSDVVGLLDGRLKLRLAAPAVDNKANKALIDFIAGRLGLPRRQVCLVAGQAKRRKKVRIFAEEEPAWRRLLPAGL
jgi:uncharacterized protein